MGALLIAAGLPLLVGLVFLETIGFRLLLAERGKLHPSQAATLLRALDQASQEQAGHLRSWISADPARMDFVVSKNQANDRVAPAAVAVATLTLDQEWSGLAADDPRLLAFLENPDSKDLQHFQAAYPELADGCDRPADRRHRQSHRHRSSGRGLVASLQIAGERQSVDRRTGVRRQLQRVFAGFHPAAPPRRSPGRRGQNGGGCDDLVRPPRVRWRGARATGVNRAV